LSAKAAIQELPLLLLKMPVRNPDNQSTGARSFINSNKFRMMIFRDFSGSDLLSVVAARFNVRNRLKSDLMSDGTICFLMETEIIP
jgi:hypothetical protein